ncbi:MAG: penicillin-binding protein 1C [Cyanobacteria bacterium P01_D01_bin.36]
MAVKKGWNRLLRHRWQRFLTCLLAMLLLIRLLPFCAPIYAADIAQSQLAVEFSDRNGLRLGTLLTRDQEHTAVVPLDKVSPLFIQAILSAEDQRFYQHGTLDMRAVVRSLLEAAQARRVVSGASTITMQLARMLEQAPSRALSQKAQEVWLAWRLSAGMSKDEILAAYVNRLPMGSNIYGVEAASQVYFGIPASELTLAQASLLAALPNDPIDLDPYFHLDKLQQRQAYVLGRMAVDGYISEAKANRVGTETVAIETRQQGIGAAPHFLFWLAKQLPDEHLAKVKTTLDLPLQRFVETQVKQVVRSLSDKNVHHAAALVIDNKTGEVLSYVGSPDYFASEAGRNDGVQSLRQPGSTLKPFLYQLALENKVIQSNTILADVPTRYAIPGAQTYSPVDYSETFHGPVRVRTALANSLNIPAVRVLEKVGVSSFLDRLHQLGFNHLNESSEHYGLGLSLGSGEVSLWELARAYLAFSHQGQLLEPVALQSDLPSVSQVSKHGQETSPSWALIRDMLNDSHARALSFGVNSVLNLPFPAAVKTGTSSDFRDTWTVGFTSEYTVATWVGNFSGEPMRKISGASGAAPLWQRIMLHLHEKTEPTSFPSLTGWVKRPICAISGYKPTANCPTVVEEYLSPDDLAQYERSADESFQLSAAYDEWLASQPDFAIAAGGLRILTPREDAYFVAGEGSRLAFEIAAPAGEMVEWWLNGELLTMTAEQELFWPMELGDWVLEVKHRNVSDGKASPMEDRVTFKVRSPDNSSTKRGFSAVNPSGE